MAPVGQKRCFKCGEMKPVFQFYKHPMMADGRLNKCRLCTKRDVRENRYAKHAYYRAYDAIRAKTPKRRELSARTQARMRIESPGKTKARNRVTNAVRDGRLTKQPCVDCGHSERVTAHHTDYRKPLLVEWLCWPCHGRRHRKAV